MSVPALRFKDEAGQDFANNVDTVNFKKVIEANKYGPRFDAGDYDLNGNVKTIRGTDVSQEGEIKYSQVPMAKLDNSFIQDHILKDGDLVMITTADCGLTGVFRKQDTEYIPSAYAVKIELNKLGYPYYFKYYFQTKRIKDEINKYVRKGTVANLPLSDIGKISIKLPNIQEQTKIANFLTAVDEKITQLTQKHDLLTQYKKGVMQQIFSQELRFKDDDGKNFPEWKVKALSDVGKTFNGLVGKTGDDFGGGQSYITYKQIFDSSKIDITKFSFVEIGENEKQNKVTFGDVFFTTSSETPNEVGFCSVLLSEVNDVYLNSFCFGYRINSFEILSPLFAQFIFHSSDFRENVIKLAQGSTRYNISKISFMETRVQLPCIHEQMKIADFLTDIDDKITATQTQLQAVKQYKQGLLQQMFV